MWIVAVMALANSLPTFAPFGMGASAAMPQAKPPKGAVWKNSVSDGKSDAKKRGIPMLVFVAGEDGSPSMTETMADPAVVKLLKHFSCVYLSKGYNRSEFQSNYAPWIAKSVSDSHRPPLLVFGTPGGEVAQDHRSEGRSLGAGDLVKHLEKALRALAPVEHAKAKGEAIAKASLAEHGSFLEDAVDRLDDALAPETAAAFAEELAWTSKIVKSAEGKLKVLTAKASRDAAAARLKELKAKLAELAKYRGKDDEKFEAKIDEAKEIVKAFLELVQP